MFARIEDAEQAREKLLEWKKEGYTHYFCAGFFEEAKQFYIIIPCYEGIAEEVLRKESEKLNSIEQYFVKIPDNLEKLDLTQFIVKIGSAEIFSINDSAMMILSMAIANGHKF